MSNYSQLDAHSRNCPSCIRQRGGVLSDSVSEWSKKKSSLPCSRRVSADVTSKMRRSASSLSYSDFGSGEKEAASDPATYLTPTQRKNNEIKRLKMELNKAQELLHHKDSEINTLRSELSKLKEVLSPDHGGESGSIPDSGNCEDLHCDDSSENETRSALLGIDFELMESTLQEEEESRQQLQVEVEKVQQQNEVLSRDMEDQRHQHEEEIQVLQAEFNQQLESINKNKNEKLEEVLQELSQSTLRCSRQQSIIENHQDIISQQSAQIEQLKSTNLALQADLDKSSMLTSGHADFDKECDEVKVLRDEIICLQKHLVSSKDKVAQLQLQLADNSRSCDDPDEVDRCDAYTQTKRTPGIDNISQVNIAELLEDSPLHPAKSGDEGPSTETILLTYQFLRRSVYYFLTDVGNRPYHLKSIERLLQFTEGEKQIIDRHKPPQRY